MTSFHPDRTTRPECCGFSFFASVRRHWERGKVLCVGLDSEYSRLPETVRAGRTPGEALLAFNIAIIEATHPFVCCYKPNSAFYEEQGPDGMEALRATISWLARHHPDIPVLVDAKRGDIGSTNAAYARAVFDGLGADAVTVSPYPGPDALQPFLSYERKGIFILVKTSNPGGGALQDLLVDGEPVYMHVARAAAREWNVHGNVGLVVGATQGEALRRVRRETGDIPILVPGIGTQGGVLRTALAARDSAGGGILINVSRSVLFASGGPDFAAAARQVVEDLDREIRA